ncbi:hypothetical protein QL285_084007 [Trifolium repens]|nr:hypothetical protein QL285_084007 [Trifolium repens]
MTRKLRSSPKSSCNEDQQDLSLQFSTLVMQERIIIQEVNHNDKPPAVEFDGAAAAKRKRATWSFPDDLIVEHSIIERVFSLKKLQRCHSV